MKKRFTFPFIPFKLVLLFVSIAISSCIDKEIERCDSLFKEQENTIESTIDFNLIDCLNGSNKKTIHLATLTFNQIKNLETLQLILKIKKDHQKIDAELQKLTEKNLIIIPKLVYDLNINPDSLKAKNFNFYLLNLLETEIKNQIRVFDKIEKTSQNIDFKLFAIKSKKLVLANLDALKTF